MTAWGQGGRGQETDVSSRAENKNILLIDMISATGHADRSVWEIEMINLPLIFVPQSSSRVRPVAMFPGSVPAWSHDSMEDKREGRRRPMLVHVWRRTFTKAFFAISDRGLLIQRQGNFFGLT